MRRENVLGIIPACAGSTRHLVCCEFRFSGSSPHVRGARVSQMITAVRCGIIPACAGSTQSPPGEYHHAGDHPRMCGEHRICCQSCKISTGSSPHVRGAPCCLVRTTPSWGSSPHVRGAPVVHGLLDGLGGIIPACAGSTTPPAQDRHATRDHPRMCGEHIQRVLRRIAEQGSSPHVRGAPVYVSWASSSSGIIPACAGSTSTARKSH